MNVHKINNLPKQVVDQILVSGRDPHGLKIKWGPHGETHGHGATYASPPTTHIVPSPISLHTPAWPANHGQGDQHPPPLHKEACPKPAPPFLSFSVKLS